MSERGKMKHLYLNFEDEKFKQLQKKKMESGAKNWEEFVLQSGGVA